MIKKPYEIFSEIVDGLRTIGTITNVAQNAAGKYLVTASNSFTVNDVATITNNNNETFEDLLIFEADSTSFIIEVDISFDSQYIYQYKSNAPYFMHEEEVKACDIIAQKKGNLQWQKYPLVLLFHPYKEKYPRSEAYTNVPEVKIGIINYATGTNAEGDKNSAIEKNSDQRYTDNFIPILDPIFDGIIAGIINHADVPIYVDTDLDYSNMDKLLLNENPLPDLLDGKLLNISDFKIKRKCVVPETQKYTLATSVDGGIGGVITPATGQRLAGEVVRVFTAPNVGYERVENTINGAPTTEAWFDLAMNSNNTVIAYFKTKLSQIVGNITAVVLEKTLQELKEFPKFGIYISSGWIDTIAYSSNIIAVEAGESINYGLRLPFSAFNLVTFTDGTDTGTANIISVVSSSDVGSGTTQIGTAIVPAGATHAFIGTQTNLIPNSYYTYSARSLFYDVVTIQTITVDINGVEDIPNLVFTDIATALTYADYGTVINIAAGVYEENNLRPVKGVSLIGADKDTTIIQGYLPEDSTTALVNATSTIDAHYTSKLQNLTITAQNMRYPVHSDGGTVENTIEADNCKIIHLGNYELWSYRDTNSIPAPNDAASTFRAMSCFGSGTKSGDIKIIRNSYLESQLRCLSTHNLSGQTSTSITIWEDNEVISHGIDVDGSQLEFNIPYYIESQDSGHSDVVIINRCTGGDYICYLDTLAHQVITNVQNLKTIYNTAGAGYSIVDQIEDCDPEFYGINQKGITNYQNNSASTIDRGSALKASGDGVELMTSSDSVDDFLGVSLQDIAPTAYADCITKGYLLRKYMLGLESTTINEGDEIGVQTDGSFDVDTGVIVATASTDENVIINNTDIAEPLFVDSIFYNWDDETELGTINIDDAEQFAVKNGNDSPDFSIDEDTGVLTFDNTHDYDNPNDVNIDNIYNVKISTYI